MIPNAQLVCAYWIDIAFVIDRVSGRASKLRQIIFSIIFASLLLIFVFIVDFALHILRPDAVHLLLTTGPLLLLLSAKKQFGLPATAPRHAPYRPAWCPSCCCCCCCWYSLAASFCCCLSLRRNSNKAFAVVGDTPPLALALQFYNDSNSSRRQQQPQQCAKQQWQQQGPRMDQAPA